MDLRQLRAFVAVAEEGSFTAAADRLLVVQSAVSATVRGLEEELGISLFDRSTRRVELSDAGRALLPEARNTLAAARLAVDAVAQVGRGLRGTVSIGTMQAANNRGRSMAEHIAAFGLDHPLVEIHARQLGGSHVLAEAVRDGPLDMAILSLPDDFPGLELTELGRETLMFACAADHPLAGQDRIRLADLVDEPFVDSPKGWGNRLVVDRLWADAGLTRTTRYELDDGTALVDFVRAGLAVAFLARSMASRAEDEVALLPLEGPEPVFRTLLAEPTARRQTAAAEAFSDFILADVETDTIRSDRTKKL